MISIKQARVHKVEMIETFGLSTSLAEPDFIETTQPCDGAMKSLRSPILSVAENFSDIFSSRFVI